MNRPFEIRFDFPLDHSSDTIVLKAMVSIDRSPNSYIIDSFLFADANRVKASTSVLPRVEIKYLPPGRWVHKDSERESALSQAIGKAIEGTEEFSGSHRQFKQKEK